MPTLQQVFIKTDGLQDGLARLRWVSVADPGRFDADPDPTFHTDADPDPNFF